jgi:energy-coupling factor transporter ATP-binding protein EcfA2
VILERIAVRNFRGVREAVFDGLSTKLCLFYGPNESGKSTLVEALHFALFERAAGQAQHKRDLQTWGGTEAPEVEVTFVDDAGERWHVEKRFVVQPRTVLSGRNVVLNDDAAEGKLRAIFGTREGTNRGVAPTDLGIWPLLWVRQGTSGIATKDALTAEARDALSTTLAAQTGVVAAGPIGQAVRELVARAYAEHWTSTGRENRELRAVVEAAEAAERARDDLHERWLAAQGIADELVRRRDEADGLDARVRDQQVVVREAAARADAARDARRALEVADREVELARQQVEQAERAHAERVATDEALAESVRRHDVAGQAAAEAERRLAEADARRRTARAAADAAEQRAVAARRVVDRVQRRAERERLQVEQADLRSTIAQAEAAEKGVRAHADSLAALPLRRTDVEKLEHLVQLRDRARDRLEAASARVVVTAVAPVSVDGQPLAAGDTIELVVAAPRTLALGDVATIRISPGGADVDVLAGQLARHGADLAAALAAADVPDLATARARLEQRLRLERLREEEAAKLSVLAKDGMHPLRERLARVEARLAAIDAHDEALPSVDEALVAKDAAEAALVVAQAEARTADEQLGKVQEAAYEARGELRRQADEVARLRGRLDGLGDASVLAAAVESARKVHGDAVVARQAHARAFQAAGGDEAEKVLVDMQAALDRLDVRRREAREDVVRLQAAIEERSEAGLYDQWQDAVAEAIARRGAADAARRRAEARRVLHEAVERAYRAMRDRFAGPVRDAVEDWVRILFPGSSLALDDDGDVIGLRTVGVERSAGGAGVVETFDQLSGGAREQFGVLVRLGIAKVLAEGRRLPVILDDALVNSDAERRGRMVEVLRRASEHLQVLVLTCHDEDFDRLAAPWQREVRGRPGRRAVASGFDA